MTSTPASRASVAATLPSLSPCRISSSSTAPASWTASVRPSSFEDPPFTKPPHPRRAKPCLMPCRIQEHYQRRTRGRRKITDDGSRTPWVRAPPLPSHQNGMEPALPLGRQDLGEHRAAVGVAEAHGEAVVLTQLDVPEELVLAVARGLAGKASGLGEHHLGAK